MNKSAHHALGEPEAVELLYDAENNIMGFRKVEPTVEHAYAIRAMGGRKDDDSGSTYMVSGTAFFKYYKIDTVVARRYLAVVEDSVLQLDLKKPGTVVTSNRAGTSTKDTAHTSGA